MNDDRRRTLYNGESSNLCGWCHHHHAGLTVRQMKLKHCQAKQCKAFEKYPDHGYWKHRDYIKAQKAKRKAERMMTHE